MREGQDTPRRQASGRFCPDTLFLGENLTPDPAGRGLIVPGHCVLVPIARPTVACRRATCNSNFLTFLNRPSRAIDGGTGRIHAAVFDACLSAVSGASCGNYYLRLLP